MLRALKQAHYTPQNLGHAGLGLTHYCHFTSPIRRYPDLVCHRALLSAIGGGEEPPLARTLEEAGSWCSARERDAMVLERDADGVARCFLLERELFEEGFDRAFEGEVTGLIGSGAFVRFGEPGGPATHEGFLPGPAHPRRLVGAQRAGHDPPQRRGRRDPDGRSGERPRRAGRGAARARRSGTGGAPSRNLGRSAVMRIRSVLLLVLVLLAVPSAASAAVRQAVPDGGATTGPCDAGAPCTLQEAVAGAAADDTVRVASGTYDLASTLDATAGGIVIEAESVVAPPLLQWSGSPDASAVTLSGTGQTLRGLRVTGTLNSAAVLVRADAPGANATLDRLQVRATGEGATGVALRDGTVRDSTVTALGAGAIAATVSGAVTGSTLVAEGSAARALFTSTLFFGGDAAVTVRSTILRGDVSGWDAAVYDTDVDEATQASADVAHSSYGAGRLRTLTVSANGSATVTEGAGNVTTVGPLLAGLPGGLDLRQLRGSPTIDAGTTAGLPADTDFDGDPRVFGAAIDIGADEYLPPPLASIQTIVVDDTDAVINGLVTPRGSDSSWRLEIGRTTAYDATVFGGAIVPKSVESQSVSAPVGGLRPATTYHARLVAVSAKGTTFGPDTTFRTLASPGARQTAEVPKLTRARLTSTKVRRGKLAGLRLTSSVAGNVQVVVSRLERGRRKGKACVTATKRCTATVRLIGISRKVLPGANGPLPIATTKLRKGRYRLTLTVVGSTGKRSKPVNLALRIT